MEPQKHDLKMSRNGGCFLGFMWIVDLSQEEIVHQFTVNHQCCYKHFGDFEQSLSFFSTPIPSYSPSHYIPMSPC